MPCSKTSLSVFALAGALIVPAVLACDTAGDDDAVLELIDDALEMENRAIEIICDCWDELDLADSRNECLDDQILPAQRRCIEDAYLRDAAASRVYLDCLVPLQAELNDCLDDKLECSNVGPTNACFDDFDLGLESCIELPNTVKRGLGDCYGDSGLYGNDGGAEPGGSGNSGSAPSDSGGDPAPGGTSGGEGPDDSADEGEVGGDPPPDDGGTTTGPINECDETTFECGDGQCIPGEWECDDVADCADGEDEAECGGVPGDSGESGDEGGEPGDSGDSGEPGDSGGDGPAPPGE